MIKRRNFLKGGLLASAILVLPPLPVELWETIAEPLANRRANKPPNFHEIHRCADCHQDFYCPDRWMAERCEVKAYCEKQGWNTDSEMCLPCKFGSEIEWDAVVKVNMAAWREAHLV